jgi:hypothetical protein
VQKVVGSSRHLAFFFSPGRQQEAAAKRHQNAIYTRRESLALLELRAPALALELLHRRRRSPSPSLLLPQLLPLRLLPPLLLVVVLRLGHALERVLELLDVVVDGVDDDCGVA